MIKCIKILRGKLFAGFCICLGLSFLVCAAELIETDEGVVGYSDCKKLSWCGYRKHDPGRPEPKHVETGEVAKSAKQPSDAVSLFDGKDLSKWQGAKWKVEGGDMITGAGSLVTKESFGSCQLHLEFCIPEGFKGGLFDRGNNGVSLMDKYEIQIFDSHPVHKQQIYADGQCGAVYGETPPMVNACLRPGKWQSYDIVFRAPVFKDGKVVEPARVTMLHNGVLVHLNTEIHGTTGHVAISGYTEHPVELPLALKGHNCAVRFRNIWIRRLGN